MSAMTIRTLIVDDEPAARRRLRMLCRAHDDIEIVGECGTAAGTLEAIETGRPDLLLLDVNLPEGDGFTVVEALSVEPRPLVVFVTAYSEHALRAFDVQAVDYLLKPFSGQRLALALERVRTRLARDRGMAAGSEPWPLRRLPIDAGGRILLVDVDHIDYLRAEGNYVRVHVGERSYLVRGSLTAMERRLAPGEFQRIHRSVIVRLDRIREIETLRHGEMALRLRDGTRLVSARSYRDQLRVVLALPG